MQAVNVVNFSGTYTLDNLKPYTEYNIYVMAVRLIGDTGIPLQGMKSRTVTGRTSAGGETYVYGAIYVYNIYTWRFYAQLYSSSYWQ